MDFIMTTVLAFPVLVFSGLLFISLFFSFCEHLKSATAASILMFVVSLIIMDVSLPVTIAAIVGYVVLGVLWSCVRWNSFHITAIDELESIKKDFESGNISRESAQMKSDKIRKAMPITENKERIACWILGFIPSFIYHFSQDLVIHIKELIVTRLSGVYGRISKKYSDKANSFQYNDYEHYEDE